MNEKFTINVNNGQKIKLYFDKNKDCLLKELVDSENKDLYIQAISSDELVSLLNWYNYQKENGNKNLIF